LRAYYCYEAAGRCSRNLPVKRWQANWRQAPPASDEGEMREDRYALPESARLNRSGCHCVDDIVAGAGFR
jgi:hypothetical protein